jgi:hypothetical protein
LVKNLAVPLVVSPCEALVFSLAIPELPHHVLGELVEILDTLGVEKTIAAFPFAFDLGHLAAGAQMKIEIAVVVHEEPFRLGRKGVGDPTWMADHRGIGRVLP